MPSQSLAVVDIPEHCGNAPRKLVIRDFLVALYNKHLDEVFEHLAEHVHWEVMGSHILQDSTAIRQWITDELPDAVELKLHTVITHGTQCAADGVVTHADSTRTHFNHVLVFSGHTKTAKIKTLRSYLIADEFG